MSAKDISIYCAVPGAASLRRASLRADGPSVARGRLPSSARDAGSLRVRRKPEPRVPRSHSGAPVGGRGSSRTVRHQPRDKVRKMRRASILRTETFSCQVRLRGRYDGRRAGAVAERLGRGLQSLVHRFESGPRLSAASTLSSTGGSRRRWRTRGSSQCRRACRHARRPPASSSRRAWQGSRRPQT
jgi:hypothetical protein